MQKPNLVSDSLRTICVQFVERKVSNYIFVDVSYNRCVIHGSIGALHRLDKTERVGVISAEVSIH